MVMGRDANALRLLLLQPSTMVGAVIDESHRAKGIITAVPAQETQSQQVVRA
jgi:hypothetical protein